MKVLVTGATGFLGSTLVKYLLDAGYLVRVTYRAGSNLLPLKGLDTEKIKTGLRNLGEAEQAVEGCQLIFHLASLYKFYSWWEKDTKYIYQVNVGITKNLLSAALKHKVNRFIFTSSISTFKDSEGLADAHSNISHYARSKRLAEKEVQKAVSKGLSAVILNPAILIGERDYRPTPSGEVIVKLLNKELPFYFNASLPVADVDSVAKAHLASINKGVPGKRYLLSNDKVGTLEEFAKLTEEISGVKRPWLKLPYFLALTAVYIDETFSFLLGKHPILPAEGVKFCKDACINLTSDQDRHDLDYRPIPLKASLKKAINWYKKNGYVREADLNRLAEGIGISSYPLFLGVKLLSFFKKIGFHPKADPWRKTAQTYLRTEHAKFILGCFRLNFFSKDATVIKLKDFIKKESNLSWKLKWTQFAAYPTRDNKADIVKAEFNFQGKLDDFSIYFDEGKNFKFKTNELLIKEVCRIYNRTKDLPDKKRPLVLKKEIFKNLNKKFSRLGFQNKRQAKRFGMRFLEATFVSFEKPGFRFRSPDFIKRKNACYGFLNIVCRPDQGSQELDLWVQCHHACNDGVPVQESLNRLKKSWQVQGRPQVDLAKYKKGIEKKLCSSQNKSKGVYLSSRFVSFDNFLKKVKEINKNNLTKKATPFRFLIWKLGNHPTFRGKKFIIPIDLHPGYKGERSLGFSAIKPAAFFNSEMPDNGLQNFQKEFDRQINLGLKRTSEITELFSCFSLLPPVFYRVVSNFMLPALKNLTADIGISIISKADAFIAPYSDIQTDGFISLSNFFTDSQQGEKVSYISCKGPCLKVKQYLKAIAEVAETSVS